MESCTECTREEPDHIPIPVIPSGIRVCGSGTLELTEDTTD
jgi:hypothetical protein